MSAPERSSLARMRSSKVTSSATVILLVWIWKILRLVFSSGRGNSILRSILPVKSHKGISTFITCHFVQFKTKKILIIMIVTSDSLSQDSESTLIQLACETHTRNKHDKLTNSPGLMRAGSSVSILLVAMMTLTSPRESNPSNWFNSSNIVLWISRSPPELESYLQTKNNSQKSVFTTVYNKNNPICNRYTHTRGHTEIVFFNSMITYHITNKMYTA